MVFPLSTIKKFHVEIVFVAWLRDLSWETKIFYLFFFQEDTSRKFLILLLSYFPVFWLQISSAFAIIFADCHGLSCVHVRASSYTGLFRVSLAGVGLMCVGLVQKISARCNTGSYVFSFFFICIFILLLALSHIYVFLFPQRVPSDLEVGYEKSILTRTETFSITICFKEPLLFITLFLKRICFYLPFTSISTWN